MVRAAFLIALALVAFAACGSSGSSSGGPGFAQGAKPQQAPPENTVGGFSIQLPSTTLMPGEETFPCWIFPLDVQGPSLMVGGGYVESQPGMHHGNVTTRPATGTGMRPCPANDPSSQLGGEAQDVLDGGSVLFGSSTQYIGTEWQSLPPGMAYPITAGFEIVARMHYLNPSTQPLTLAPKYRWYTVDEKKVTQVLAPFAWQYTGFQIAPGQTLTVTGSCYFPGPMKIVFVLPHMHKLGTAFTASFIGGPLDGKDWLQSRGYDPGEGVMQVFDPPIDLSQGQGSTFSCTWDNTTDETVVEGVGNNEMCILFGYGFPTATTYTANVDDSNKKCVYVAAAQTKP
jgi:hypothetical protein